MEAAMIETLKSPDHVLAYRLDGVMTAEDYDVAARALEHKLKSHSHLGLYADMTDFKTMTAEALVHDLKFHMSHLGLWKRFPRIAILTDEPWLKAMVSVMGAILPHVEARAFAPGEKEVALAWASVMVDA
jgi:hypothetical protein